MVHLFLNGDDYLTSQAIAGLKRALGDPELASLNIAEVAGERATAADILAQASMMPFLCERRLLLVTGYLTALARRMKQSQSPESAAYAEAATFLEGLPAVPDTCDLVIVEAELDEKGPLWKGFVLPGKDESVTRPVPGLTALSKQPDITLHALATPKDPSEWIRLHARERGFQVEPLAVRLLADFIGSDLRRLQAEIEKLSLFAGSRPITPADVRLLVSDTKEEAIWALMDALSAREASKAFRTLHELWRDDENPFGLLSNIANNYRTLIRVKTLMGPPHNLRDNKEIAGRLKASPFPVQKAMGAASRYSFGELEAVLARLLEANLAMVTGADQATEIELLVADLTLKPLDRRAARAPAYA